MAKQSRLASNAIPETVEDSFAMLTQRGKESGISSFIEYNKEIYAPIADAVRRDLREKAGSKLSELDERFVVNREVMAEVFRRHLYWAIRWMTPQQNIDQVHRVHYVICDFLERGMDAIPEEWRKVGEFYWRGRFVKTQDSRGKEKRVDVTPQIIMMPRGEGKSFCFTEVAAIREVAIDPGSKWFIGQGTLPLAQQLVNAIQKLLQYPYLALLMPDVFCPTKKEYLSRGGRMTTNLIDIIQRYPENGAFDVRQEYTFTAVSLGSSTTGSHPNGGFYDDIDNEDSTRTQAEAEKAEKFWRNQSALANRPGIFPKRLTDTFHYEDGVTDRVKVESTYFRMPLDWVDKEGKRCFINSNYTAERVDAMKVAWKDWAQAHGCIRPMPRDTSRVNLGFDRNNKSHLLDITDDELVKMKQNYIVVTAGDPAYVDTGKKVGDKKSRATILHMLRDASHTYIFDIWQTFGVDIETWRDRVVKEVMDKKSDVYIQDTLGTQMSYFSYVEKAVREATNRGCRSVMHDKKMNIGKVAVANEILREMFLGGEITVLRTPSTLARIQLVIDQLTGVNLGMDIIDCLVYGVDDIEAEIEYPLAMRRRHRAAQGQPPQQPVLTRKIKMSGKV